MRGARGTLAAMLQRIQTAVASVHRACGADEQGQRLERVIVVLHANLAAAR
jgi:hypothetical protein